MLPLYVHIWDTHAGMQYQYVSMHVNMQLLHKKHLWLERTSNSPFHLWYLGTQITFRVQCTFFHVPHPILSYCSFTKEGPWVVHHTLGSKWEVEVSRHSSYQYCVVSTKCSK